MISLAASTDASQWLGAGPAVGGIRFSVASLGALRHLSASIPNHRRAAVMSGRSTSSPTCRCHCPPSWPASSSTPLGLQSTFEIFAAAVAAIAPLLAFEA